jgi:superfamily II DNA helicase RecQ
LPAKIRGSNTTVVITPLIELGSQLKRTRKEFGLDVEMFVKGRTRRASVMIVVTETAGSDDFRDFVMELQLNKQLDRVVWDEAHMLVKDRNFRLTIAVSQSLKLRCQIVFVTATCPPSLVNEICELMVLSTPHVVRQDYITGETSGRFNPTNYYPITTRLLPDFVHEATFSETDLKSCLLTILLDLPDLLSREDISN